MAYLSPFSHFIFITFQLFLKCFPPLPRDLVTHPNAPKNQIQIAFSFPYHLVFQPSLVKKKKKGESISPLGNKESVVLVSWIPLTQEEREEEE